MKRALLLMIALGLGLLGPGVARSWQAQARSGQSERLVGAVGPVGIERGLAANPLSVGGYVEGTSSIALAVEDNGRVHVLWTGKLNPYFDTFAFYSSSPDGVTWTPYQIVNYYNIYDPQVVVDNARHRAHLIYRSSYDGIVHQTVENGVVSAPTVVDGSESVSGPRLAVDETTGKAYAVWQQAYSYRVDESVRQLRFKTWSASWNGQGWSSRTKLTTNEDTANSAIAVAPGGRVMAAYFQQWVQSQAGPLDPGWANAPRTAYAPGGASLSLRQAVDGGYELPETDAGFVLGYSPASNKFYMLTNHMLWPGHSVVRRYVWDGVWSAPLEISGAPSSANPLYVGASQSLTSTYYVYQSGSSILARTESNGVLSAPQNIGQYLSGSGFVGVSGITPYMDKAGRVHFAFAGTKDGVAGLYYVRQTTFSE